ncbi:MAG: metallophosphoesterase, partial [Candidatus Omnitrophica bacterium]|nr:metallophosphoesterase [Candidatus Omnitrophota bacterium]
FTRRSFLKWAAGGGVVALIGSYPVFIERSIVLMTRYKIPVPNLPAELAGLRIVQLADIHHGFLVSLNFVKEVVRRANEAGGDLIVNTGDHVHEKRATGQIDAVWPILADLEAPLGVYSILGNHDHWADTDRSVYWLHQTGQDLHHKQKAIERNGGRLWLVGAGDYWEDHRNLDEEMEGIPESDCRIVLAHNPDSADTSFSRRVDLMVSGHTHGGQVVIPFVGPPVLPVRNKAYSSGLISTAKGFKVFISRGIGWAIYPVRFNCYPEIATLELFPE